MIASSSSDEKSPEIECTSGSIMSISKLTANYPLIPRNELIAQEQLGAGSYGSVFKGIWNVKKASKPLIVALKKVFMLEREVDILSQVRHRNIIQFFGVSQANPDFYIVTEYAENGSLFEYLHNAKADLVCDRILKWAKQIAHGVAYLHYEAPKTIIHRDLKSKNVVLGKKMVCKICDFGTSKDLTHSHTAPTWGGTAAWMSPEIINQREGITTATDVWSYGVLLWELLSREIPYKGLTEFKIYSITSQEGCKLVLPNSCPKRLSELLKRCWFKDPKERIHMHDIVNCFQAITQNKEEQNECADFVKQKEEWLMKIQEQFEILNALELDYEKRKEELKRWEQILRRRENSHRNFLHIIDVMNATKVEDWDVDCVCEWVQYIVSGKDIKETVIDKIISQVLQHEINGSRLLQVTERDLQNLLIESLELRQHIILKVSELQYLNNTKGTGSFININQKTSSQLFESPTSITDDFFNFPSLKMSAEIEARNKIKKKSLLEYSIVLIVGLYCREILNNNEKKVRFKVFLDSDWNDLNTIKDIPSEIAESETVIKDVFVSMINTIDDSILLEVVRCECPPFGYLEWTEIDAKKLPFINVTLAVTYTDQIIQPRSTQINIKLDIFENFYKNIHTKVVPLKIRANPTNTSISRVNSSLFNKNQSPIDKSPLQGVWQMRRRSVDVLERNQSVFFNGIIPGFSNISVLRQHYQQRFARENLKTLNVITDNKTSPLTSKNLLKHAKTTNLKNYNTLEKSLDSTKLNIKENRSTSAYPLSNMLKNRKESPLTVIVQNAVSDDLNKNKTMLKNQVLKSNHQNNASQRYRTLSETECSKIKKNSLTSLKIERPKFYVCDDYEASSYSNEYDLSPNEMLRQKSKISLSLISNSFDKNNSTTNEYNNVKIKNNNSIKNNFVCEKFQKNDLIEKNLSKQNNNKFKKQPVNDSVEKSACPCRISRRITQQVDENLNNEIVLKNSAKQNYDESLLDRKNKAKINGQKSKKIKHKILEENYNTEAKTNLQLNDCQKAIVKNVAVPNKISQHVYGGYNKWRWKT